MAFGDDGTILYTPAGFLTAELLALAIDDDLPVRWSIDVSDVANTVSRPVVDDDRIWIGAASPFPLGGTAGSTQFGLIGIPTDLAEYADWSSTLPTRGFTEVECRQFLGGPCADVVSDTT